MSRRSYADLIADAGSGPHSPPWPDAPCACRHDGTYWLAMCDAAREYHNALHEASRLAHLATLPERAP